MSVTAAGSEPAWKRRAVDRSINAAKLLALQRAQNFLDAARAIMAEKGTTDFTVQEVIDRSGQSLRSFYLQFDGKHELLLALYEDALLCVAGQIREATSAAVDSMDRLRIAVSELFEFYRPDSSQRNPLFNEFAPSLMLTHPAEVRGAFAPLTALFIDIVADLAAEGRLRSGVRPHRIAVITMQSVMTTAHMSVPDDVAPYFTSDEVWHWCRGGFAA